MKSKQGQKIRATNPNCRVFMTPHESDGYSLYCTFDLMGAMTGSLGYRNC